MGDNRTEVDQALLGVKEASEQTVKLLHMVEERLETILKRVNGDNAELKKGLTQTATLTGNTPPATRPASEITKSIDISMTKPYDDARLAAQEYQKLANQFTTLIGESPNNVALNENTLTALAQMNQQISKANAQLAMLTGLIDKGADPKLIHKDIEKITRELNSTNQQLKQQHQAVLQEAKAKIAPEQKQAQNQEQKFSNRK